MVAPFGVQKAHIRSQISPKCVLLVHVEWIGSDKMLSVQILLACRFCLAP